MIRANDSSPKIRCAIYCRKSTEDGLEQEFNSLDAQREAGEAFVASQRNEGWVCLPDQYDDGGFSGGNMDRPGIRQLMADIEAGHIDCVVVYKVDRLSRSLMDFARIMETFEKHNVSFVSVTQQFNTHDVFDVVGRCRFMKNHVVLRCQLITQSRVLFRSPGVFVPDDVTGIVHYSQ